MASVITQPCIDVRDGTCVDVCPVDCIAGEAEDRQLFIDPERCIDCDPCATVCPVDATYRDEELPPECNHFADANGQYFTQGEKCQAP